MKSVTEEFPKQHLPPRQPCKSAGGRVVYPAGKETTAATVGYPTWCPIKPRSFTILELLVVVIIIGSLLLLSLPRFRGVFNNLTFDNFSQNLATRMRYLQERAYVEQNIYLLNFNLANKVIEIKFKDKVSGQFIEVKGLLGRKITISENIQIETQTSNILFLPDGAIQGSDIKISGFQNKATIFINESIGSIKLETDAQ